MRKGVIIIIGLALGIALIMWLWPKEQNAPKANTDIVNLFIDFKGLVTPQTFVILHTGDVSVKPTYYKLSDIQDLSPTFALRTEGLHHFESSSGDLFSYLYLKKGGEYHIKLEPGKTTFKGTDQKLNQFLVSYQQTVNDLTRDNLPNISSVKSESANTFITRLDQMEAKHNQMIQGQSILSSDVKSSLIENYKNIKRMILLTFLDKKYTNKQANTAIKYVKEEDFNNEAKAMQNPNYARAALAFFELKSLTSTKVKQSDVNSFKTFLMENGLSPSFAERLSVEKCKRPKLGSQIHKITQNQHYIDYLSNYQK